MGLPLRNALDSPQQWDSFREWLQEVWDHASTLPYSHRAKGQWKAGESYVAGDYVERVDTLYLALTNHVSSVDFDEDRASGRWMFLDAALEALIQIQAKVNDVNGVVVAAIERSVAASAEDRAATEEAQRQYNLRNYPGTYDANPVGRPVSYGGGASQIGDSAMVLLGGEYIQKLFTNSGWIVPNLDGVALQAPTGASLVGMPQGGYLNNFIDETTPVAAGGLQPAISYVFGANGRGMVKIPSGRFDVPAKVSLDFSSGGGAIQGRGPYIGNPRTNARGGPNSVLYWTGAEGGTLLGGIGNTGLKLQGFSLVGRKTASGARAGILYHCEQDTSDTFGSGVAIMEAVSFYDAAVGMQMGTNVSDHNCADWLIFKFSAQLCDVAFLVKNQQGLNYNFQSPGVSQCKTFVRMERGGNFFTTCFQAALSGGTGTDEWLFDFQTLTDNSSLVVVDGLRVEQDTKQILRARGLGHVLITGYEEAQANQALTQISTFGVAISIKGGRVISCSAAAPHFVVANNTGGQRASLSVEDLHFDVDTFDLREWVGLSPGVSIPIQLKGCTFGQLGAPLGDINSHMVYGPARNTGITTDATPTYLLFDGGATARGRHNICPVPADTTTDVEIKIVGRGASADASFTRRALIKNLGGAGGTTTLVGSVQTIGTDNNVPGWTVTVQPTSFGGLQVLVTGAAATTINWTAIFTPASA